MRLMRTLPLAAAVATAALVAVPAPASAHLVDVTTSSTGYCPAGYIEVAQAGLTVVCVHVLVPRYRVVVDGSLCPDGYSEYSVLSTVKVCLDLTH